MKYRKREEKLKLFRKHGLGKKPVARVAYSLGCLLYTSPSPRD